MLKSAAQSINVIGLNDFDALAGSYTDSASLSHGFVAVKKTSGYKIVTFDAPPPANQTITEGFNNLGEVTGYSVDANLVEHGFVRDPAGKFTNFDVPGSTFVFPRGINDLGVVAGQYYDSQNARQGFLRAPDGKLTTFDVPNTGETYVSAINLLISVVGRADGIAVNNAYIRYLNGSFTEFDATAVPSSTTAPTSINLWGAVTGIWYIGRYPNNPHGFIRECDGTITTFDEPNSNGQYTYSAAINAQGTIVGSYVDPNGSSHGFIRTPSK